MTHYGLYKEQHVLHSKTHQICCSSQLFAVIFFSHNGGFQPLRLLFAGHGTSNQSFQLLLQHVGRTGCTGSELIAQCQNTSEKGNKCYDVMINCVSHCHSNVVQVHKEENMPLNWLG